MCSSDLSCALAAGRRTPVHIKVDTGMGRAGVWHAQARELIAYVRSAPHLVWRGLYTHFAEADADADGVVGADHRAGRLDDGERVMKPGDVVVQLGNWHGWCNPREGSRMAFVMMGAKYEG